MENHNFDRYKVNPKLYAYAISDLPNDSTPLEEAWHIYSRLCKKLEYSLDYYIEEILSGSPFSPIKSKMSTLSYVETVDGEKNKEVVCFVFGAIYSYILYDRGLISEEDFRDNFNVNENYPLCFDLNHTPITCKIDGVRLRIDACMGIDMDLNISKYGNHRLQGWREGFLGNDPVAKEKLTSLMQREKEKVEAKAQKQQLYKALKLSKNDFRKFSFQEKLDLFLEAMKETPTYSFGALSYVAEVYKNIFSDYSLLDQTKHIDSTFIFEKGEVKEYLFVNEKGYRNLEGSENFDHLKIYEISLKNKHIKQVKRGDLLMGIFSRESVVISDNPAKHNGSEMMNQATTLSPAYITIKGGTNGK